MIEVLADNKEKFNSIMKFCPNELISIARNKNLEDYRYILPRFNAGNLPFNFKMNRRGGWISPTGTWYLATLTGSPDDALRNRLLDSSKYNNNLRVQALKEGWIRFDWEQPSLDLKFSTNDQQVRKFIITMDKKRKIDNKTYLAIISMAMVYTVLSPKNFFFELRLITNYDKLQYETYKSRGFEFFNLDLNRQRG